MSDDPTPTPDAPAPAPAPETPPIPDPAPPSVPEAPPAPPAPSVTTADLDAIRADFRAVGDQLRDVVSGLTSPPSTGAGADPPAPSRPKDPRSWLQRVWFGPRRF